MQHHSISAPRRTWNESGHASLCLLGVQLTYTPVQKLEMFLVAVLAGAKAVSHTETTVRLDPALVSAFGLPGCAEQSTIAQTLNAATEQDVADLQAALGEIFDSYSQSRQHEFTREFLVLDVDLSPLPESRAC
jgi:hypothetical protein